MQNLLTTNESEFIQHIEHLGKKAINTYSLQLEDFIELISYLTEELLIINQSISLETDAQHLSHLLTTAKAALAKLYLSHELKIIRNFVNEINQENLNSPLKLHNAWFNQLDDALSLANIPPPEMDHLNCEFSKWLSSMEFEMLINSYGEDKFNQQAKILLAHREIHVQGNHIISFYKNRDFQLAYSHVKRLFEALLISEEYLRQMQLKFQEAPEAYFYDYVEEQILLTNGLTFLLTFRMKKRSLKYENRIESFYNSNTQQTLKYEFKQAGYDFIGIDHSQTLKFLIKPLNEQSSLETENFCKTFLHQYLLNLSANTQANYQTLGLFLDDLNTQGEEHLGYFLQTLKHHDFDEAFYFLKSEEVKVLQKKSNLLYQRRNEILSLLKENQLELFFQPIYRQRSTDRIFVETLVRAPIKEGFLSADEFLYHIEENDLTVQLDLMVMSKLGTLLPQLKKAANRISVNVYPTSLTCLEIIEKIKIINKQALEEGVELIFEITEQTAIKSMATLEMLSQKFGVVFAMDDFGSGYSNMLPLVQMAESGIIKVIKIDGSLVRGLENSQQRFTLIKMLVDIAKTLNLQPVILEYVENQATVELLNTLNHDVLYQGFYFDKALPLKTLLKKYTPQ